MAENPNSLNNIKCKDQIPVAYWEKKLTVLLIKLLKLQLKKSKLKLQGK